MNESSKSSGGAPLLTEVLPKSGLVYSEKGSLSAVLCKPKIMPIKSMSVQQQEEKVK
jgi:BBSome-interacting protein 1